MPTLYTVSYPEVAPEDLSFMERFRQLHDLPYLDVVAAHFTMVFSCKTIELAEYTKHIEAVARQSEPIRFSCKYAMLGADDFDDTAYVFLVPDEGYSGISLLHDRLYTGLLQPFLKLDVPFVPHITIGTLKDRSAAKALCDELNRTGVHIEGTLRALTIGALEDGKLKNLSSHALGKASFKKNPSSD
ncbi:2'-5' RNA ligase family protein [Roseateles sp.]|uniref:2'-5' RNA ligase family protein n=1 Tax=Roseateles sp. TaxID=1971397 RepID=UPI003BA55FB1